MSELDTARICKARARKESEKWDGEWDKRSGQACWWWSLDIVLNLKKSITATCYEFDKPCYLDTCLRVLGIGGTLNPGLHKPHKVNNGESWPLHRAKAACLFCNSSGTAEEAGKVVVYLKNSSVNAAFMGFELVWVCVNVFSCLWFLEVTTIFSKGRNSRGSNSRWEVYGGAGGFFVFQFKRLLAWE